ncbi:MAG: hypothetical protein HN929_12435 [Chloroflexi bacterium]|jgi:ArsR family metal-binding transcriptional regulator|nr:hypothetical protein [Chloroflexota bacterium]MBT7082248.1 hypothetical protein [Chloroflexota bacterium]MBT7289539.1 hypothetical protein [Chloroflexota bacterium]
MNNSDEMLIDDYKMALVEMGCEPGSCEYKIELTPLNDISHAFPYINAGVECIDYLHDAKFLSFKHGDIFCSMTPSLITIAMIHNREEAQQKTDIIVSAINDIWRRHSNIEPKYTGRKAKPPTLSVYKLLPRTNCGDCGLPTCMAFASALINGHSEASNCPDLDREEYSRSKRELLTLLSV